MKLYLNGWEADLVEKALSDIVLRGDADGEHAQIILDRIDNCKHLQKPHSKKHNPT